MNSTTVAQTYILLIASSSVLTIIGIVGNIFVIYILTRPKFYKESLFRYFLVSNLICILIIVLVIVYSLIQFLKLNVSILFCQVYTFLTYFAYCFYSWVSVVNSIDRLLTLKYPRRFSWFQKFKYQALTLTIIATILILINIPRAVYVRKSDKIMCAIKDNQIGFMLNLVNLIISNILPFFIMLLSTCILLHYFISHKFRLNQLIVNYKREREFVKNVIFICIFSLTR